MKLTRRGFTLVELMIVIAIIGILAAALFPSLTSYLKRSRDAARTSHMKDISTALGAYYTDKEDYPPFINATGCVPVATLTGGKYMDSVPTDPVASRAGAGCATASTYGYAQGSGATGTPQFLVYGVFETELGGNILSSSGNAEIILATSTGWFNPTKRTVLDSANYTKKGNGSGYVLYK